MNDLALYDYVNVLSVRKEKSVSTASAGGGGGGLEGGRLFQERKRRTRNLTWTEWFPSLVRYSANLEAVND